MNTHQNMAPKVSYWQVLAEPGLVQHLAVDELLQDIKCGEWQKEIEAIREELRKAEAAQRLSGDAVAQSEATTATARAKCLKKELPSICFSGLFDYRSAKGFIEASGLLSLDLDDLPPERLVELRQRAAQCPHVFAVFVSPLKG